MDEFNQQTNEFIKWFKKNGGEISEKVEIADLRKYGYGRGIIVGKNKSIIDEDEVIFTIPKNLVIDIKRTKLIEKIPELIELSPYLSLVGVLISESNNIESNWYPYLNILPKSIDYTPIFWQNKDEINLLLGTGIIEKLGKEECELEYKNELLPIINRYPDIFNGKDISIEAFHYWASIVMSYSFDCDDDEEEIEMKGMFPLADILNADVVDCNAHLYYPDDEDKNSRFEMKSIKPIQPGCQIFNTYGELSNCDLLRQYGYVKFGGSPFDYVDLSTQFIIDILIKRGLITMDHLYKRLEILKIVDNDVYNEIIDGDDDDDDTREKFKSEFQIECNRIKIPRELKIFVSLLLAHDDNSGDNVKQWYKSNVKHSTRDDNSHIWIDILNNRLNQYYNYNSKWWTKQQDSINKRNAAQVVKSQIDIIESLIEGISSSNKRHKKKVA